jgi:hypothetical protein
MGIKFRCPNGHKMHVKSFLAGKKGICPKCGVRIEIPLVSDVDAPPASALEHDSPQIGEIETIEPIQLAQARPRGPAFGLDLSAPSQPTTAQKTSGPAAPADGSGLSETAPLEFDNGLDLGDDLSLLSDQPAGRASSGRASVGISLGSELPSSGPLPPAMSRPAPQTSNASWYASLAGGATVGPMSADAILRGLEQGQFTTDSLVWRDGWSQWQPLGSVLSQMNTPSQPAAAGAASLNADDPLADALGRQVPASSTMVHGRHRTRKELRSRVALILMGLVIILFALMMYVLSIKHD